MEKLVALATRAPKSRVKHDDDFVDRLNSRYTSLILVVFTVVISLANLGKPITCWSPKHFTSNHIKFTNSYCWVKNTYYLGLEEEIPAADEHHKRDMIVYYQWIPFILLTQVSSVQYILLTININNKSQELQVSLTYLNCYRACYLGELLIRGVLKL